MEVILNREQKIVLLRALKDGRIDTDKLKECGLDEPTRFTYMTDEELENEIVRLEVSTRTCSDPLTERICKACYKAGGCWVSHVAFKTDRDMDDKIRAIFSQNNAINNGESANLLLSSQ